jgi:putative endopeptidase
MDGCCGAIAVKKTTKENELNLRNKTCGIIWVAALCLAPTGCGTPESARHGLDLSLMDSSVKPCEDFYRYANGAWLKTAQMPEKNYRWGMAQEVRERNARIVTDILQQLAAREDWPLDSLERKISDFYNSGLNADAEKAGIAPLAARLERIKKIGTKDEFAVEVARLHAEKINPCFDFSIDIDDKNASSNIAYLLEGGLGLPQRDYYLEDDQNTLDLRNRYLRHVTRMFELFGDDAQTAAQNGQTVLSIETRLAGASLPVDAWDDPQSIYHKMSREELRKEAPGFAWETYFKAVGLPDTETDLLVEPVSFIREFAAMGGELRPADWRAYLSWHLMHALGRYLNEAIAAEHFDFYQRTMQGVKEQTPRSERIQQVLLNSSLDMALGRMFVEKAFSAEAKALALEMVDNIKLALRETILELDWMTESTKANALKKLETLGAEVGYPDRWPAFTALKIDRGPFVLNVLRDNAFRFQRELASLGGPADRGEWETSPAVLHAYCRPWKRKIYVSAAILQPPFFDPEADAASNYGAIGTIIAHEITHDFDTSGRQYDERGNLRDWWTEKDAAAFEARTKPFIKQFDAYRPLPDKAIDGKQTLDENIADLGGLKIAYAAFERSLGANPQPGTIDGFTPRQRFFIAFAQLYREITTPEFLRRRLESDSHSPMEYRVIGPLANFPPFQEAFGCRPGDPMRPADEPRPAIW